MPLEAMRFDLTPVGLHHLLIHYDIPEVDTETWRLEVDGLVERPLSLSLDDLRRDPPVGGSSRSSAPATAVRSSTRTS